jgi:PhnB protein
MPNNPSPPQGLIPYLIVRNAREAVAFYQRALNATLLYELPMADGRIGHAELAIGSAHLMLADEFPEMDCVSPTSGGGSSVSLTLYVDDVDAVVQRAVEAGATLTRPIKNEFYGDRVAHLTDPFGHRWSFNTRIEDVSPEEMRARMQAER